MVDYFDCLLPATTVKEQVHRRHERRERVAVASVLSVLTLLFSCYPVHAYKWANGPGVRQGETTCFS